MDPLLEVKEISKAFGGLQALRNINFTVKAGERIGIIGPNGAGKTTLFNILSGFSPANSGTVLLDGQSILGKKPYQIVNLGLTRTWQLVKPFSGMKVLEAVSIPTFSRRGQNTSSSGLPWPKRIARILEGIGLAEKVWEDVENLSHSELRLLDISRAMATNPRILLLDEPFSGLSPKETEKISRMIMDLNREGLTVLIIEHRLKELMKLVQRVIVIHFGEKIAEGPPENIIQDPRVIEAYLGERSTDIGLA